MRSIWDGGRALAGRGVALEVPLARPDRPSRCTLPITALRVMPPSSAAIWLADKPSDQSFFKSSTRSSVHDIHSPSSTSGQQALFGIPHWAGRREAAQHALITQRFRRLSAARYVVLDNQKATIWPDSGARVAKSASTCSSPVWMTWA